MLDIILLFLMVLLLIIKTKKSLHMLQQNLYNENNRYIKWILKNIDSFMNIEVFVVFFAGLMLLVTDSSSPLIIIYKLIIILLYCILIYDLYKKYSNEQSKTPLVITSRIKRVIVTTIIIYLLPIIYLIYSRINIFIEIFSLLTIICYLNCFVVLLASFINFPIEKLVFMHYKLKARNKLESMTNLKMIGITGSYGKTSSKNILADILNIKYNTLPTPRNLNTYNGLMITINNNLDKFTDVFIAEMGAYVRGEIRDLCKFVKPKYGILTRIGTAHLESFGSEENIQKAKFELIESLPSDGIGILNKDDPKQVSYKLKNDVRIIWIGIDSKDVDVRATNIKCNNNGTTFDIIFKGDKKKYKFTTKLLGEHNVYNILAGVALGREFGIEIEDLIQAVKGVKSVEHRLELKDMGSFYMIDDAYNSNPVGAKSAVEVLKMMNGVRIVVTPGMIELGKKENYYNKEFGKQIADGADYVVLIGDKKTKPIKEGLIEKGFDKDNIIVYNDVRDAYKFINALKTRKHKYALFENDLPDTYNE